MAGILTSLAQVALPLAVGASQQPRVNDGLILKARGLDNYEVRLTDLNPRSDHAERNLLLYPLNAGLLRRGPFTLLGTTVRQVELAYEQDNVDSILPTLSPVDVLVMGGDLLNPNFDVSALLRSLQARILVYAKREGSNLLSIRDAGRSIRIGVSPHAEAAKFCFDRAKETVTITVEEDKEGIRPDEFGLRKIQRITHMLDERARPQAWPELNRKFSYKGTETPDLEKVRTGVIRATSSLDVALPLAAKYIHFWESNAHRGNDAEFVEAKSQLDTELIGPYTDKGELDVEEAFSSYLRAWGGIFLKVP